ncbi:MAG: hypothetical protein QGH39_07645 [Candidatus Thermoplasmatota archaeon]|jgi:hypothetical protein|nr:hypothetical protein [Candidatus Thermoplasmatota archaeon]MDP7265417.1 hypothetical protein [Candidatus Thermoplasmatota archaeon]
MIEDDNKIVLTFTQRDSYGWMDLEICVGSFNKMIPISDVFPPFVPMIRCMENILLDKLPTEFEIDEEGKIDKFSFNEGRHPEEIRFILSDVLPPYTIFLDDYFNKFQLVKEFYSKLKDFINRGYNRDLWIRLGEEQDLNLLDFSKIEKLIQ